MLPQQLDFSSYVRNSLFNMSVCIISISPRMFLRIGQPSAGTMRHGWLVLASYKAQFINLLFWNVELVGLSVCLLCLFQSSFGKQQQTMHNKRSQAVSSASFEMQAYRHFPFDLCQWVQTHEFFEDKIAYCAPYHVFVLLLWSCPLLKRFLRTSEYSVQNSGCCANWKCSRQANARFNRHCVTFWCCKFVANVVSL